MKLIFFTVFFLFLQSTNPSVETVIAKSLASIQSVKNASYTFRNSERINGNMLFGEQIIIYQQEPFRVYMHFITPHKGAKISYSHRDANSKLTFDPQGFPYTTLDLDPKGYLARENNHHTIFKVGFKPLGDLLQFLFDAYPNDFAITASTTIDNQPVWKLEFSHPNFAYFDYLTKSGDTTDGLAEKFGINEYAIIDKNKEVRSFGSIKSGITIKIPNGYSKSIIFYIRKDDYLPISQEIFDETGLFEKYDYSKIKINSDEEIKRSLEKI